MPTSAVPRALAAAVVLAWAMPDAVLAQTPTNIITNGTFNQTTNGEGALYTGTGTAPLGSTQVTGWSACSTGACNSADGGYPFLFVATPGIANGNASSSSTGFYDPWDDSGGAGSATSLSNVAIRSLWGTGNSGVGQGGTSSGAFNGYGPGGTSDTSNFIIDDGDYHATALQQTLNNLVVNDHYTLTFDWAAGQWNGFSGATTEQFQVSFGGATQSTSVFDLNSHSFSGWMVSTMTFTATSSTELLSFLAIGTPAGQPPILLLDDVAAYDTPEPATWGVFLVGITCLAFMARRRFKAIV